MKQWIKYSTHGVMALVSSIAISQPALAQVPPAERAIFLIQREAAVLLNTLPGNINIVTFNSIRSDQGLTGYTASVRASETETTLSCTVRANESVTCESSESSESSNAAPDNRCSAERRQDTILERQFARRTNTTGTNDFAVRIYNNIHSASLSYLCMNVFDIQNSTFVGIIPLRSSTSSNVTAYYSDVTTNEEDYQVIRNQDGSYTLRRSKGTTLLYEGYSQ